MLKFMSWKEYSCGEYSYYAAFLFFIIFNLVFIKPVIADVGRIELYTIQSITLTDQQFLMGKKNGNPVTISGELRYPRKIMKKYPVIVLVHGSGGVSGYVDDWAQEINKMGVAVFILDSFTGRGLYKVNNDQSKLGRLAMIFDAYRALDLLAEHNRVDPKKIAIMGFSRGGQVTLYSSMKRFQRLHGSKHEFSGYIAFYPSCITQYKEEQEVVDNPIRIFHGGADNYNPVVTCRAFVNRLKKDGKDVVLHEYPNAHHVFDYTKLVKPIVLKKAQTTRACRLKEVDEGVIVNVKSGKDFTYNDPCVERGPTIAFNRAAYDKTKQELSNFISSLFQLL
ncbi:MAG: carboxymethylenebutenolidase [endosymbiont of Galathealinum brachiosum]|uniref:Carboxymethylenebutenolidase n=1 Tax=endosymbiont of Galathealinum brachiosum TaxID=2200906 RepID=A0A370DF61_9GAMM|nr:MAG: carboxymethylenebutenolidase [endosymbiont of Galathealinum brachiosum]